MNKTKNHLPSKLRSYHNKSSKLYKPYKESLRRRIRRSLKALEKSTQ